MRKKLLIITLLVVGCMASAAPPTPPGTYLTNFTKVGSLTNGDYFIGWRGGSNAAFTGFDLAGMLNSPSNALAATVIRTNAALSDFQAAFDTGGNIWIQPGTYTLSGTVTLTKGCHVYGNNAVLKFNLGATGFMFDSGPNSLSGPCVIENVIFDGQEPLAYNSAAYMYLNAGAATPYYNSNYKNRSGLRVETTQSGQIHNCIFRGWGGQGCLLINTNTIMDYRVPRIGFVNNVCYSNFMGLLVAGANFDTAGYYQNPAGGWLAASAEYTPVLGNQFICNYIGCEANGGNGFVQMNQMTANWIGLLVDYAPNGGHGLYCNNTMNHNQYPVWFEGSVLVGNVKNNSFQATLTGDPGAIIFNGVTSIHFSENYVSGFGIVVTNGCTGFIKNNCFYGTWGTDTPTNFVGSTITVTGNHSYNSSSTDGSQVSALETSHAY